MFFHACRVPNREMYLMIRTRQWKKGGNGQRGEKEEGNGLVVVGDAPISL